MDQLVVLASILIAPQAMEYAFPVSPLAQLVPHQYFALVAWIFHYFWSMDHVWVAYLLASLALPCVITVLLVILHLLSPIFTMQLAILVVCLGSTQTPPTYV